MTLADLPAGIDAGGPLAILGNAGDDARLLIA